MSGQSQFRSTGRHKHHVDDAPYEVIERTLLPVAKDIKNRASRSVTIGLAAAALAGYQPQ
jgi:hypothetical protein